MFTITIIEGITLTATQSTIDTYRREALAAQREREAIEWLRTHDRSDELYSDIFKDVYGFRPRWWGGTLLTLCNASGRAIA